MPRSDFIEVCPLECGFEMAKGKKCRHASATLEHYIACDPISVHVSSSHPEVLEPDPRGTRRLYKRDLWRQFRVAGPAHA